jgi:4-amino-4-deoxy-L-arabinose transferase-like glycosyltransferase
MSDAASAPAPEPEPVVARAAAPRGPLAALVERTARWDVPLAIVVSCLILLPGLSSFILIDPWETHYAEVARRMLQDHDWVHLKWQNEVFRSKPVLPFWMMAAGMSALGIGAGGGYSGEMVSSDLVVLAIRLPFTLFAIAGLVVTFWMLRRLVSRRAAWLGLIAIAACPFFTLVARQAITDMPMVACMMGALSLFAVAAASGDEPLRPLWRKIDGYHLFLAVAGLFIVGQGVYYLVYFHHSPALGPGVRVWQPGLQVGGGTILLFAALVAIDLLLLGAGTRRQLYMRWAYLLVGVSVLAKGPVGPGIAFICCGAFVVLTSHWRHLLDYLKGAPWMLLAAVPWHIAMFFKDGRAFTKEYFGHHWFGRYGSGVFGDRGTFDYFASQLAVGMFPLVGLVPFALAWLATRPLEHSGRGYARLIVGLWAIGTFAMMALSQTKFHHYILPAVPGLALVVALWLDDAWGGPTVGPGGSAAAKTEDRGRSLVLGALGGVLAILLVARDLVGEQKQLIELFIFRYDRPWPSGEPWNVDLSGAIIALAAVATMATGALAFRRLRRPAIVATLGAALLFALWAANPYMGAAAPHWGQRELHKTYYRLRQIHGVEIKYFGLRDLADDWKDGAYRVETVLPDGFAAGAPMRARLIVPGAGLPGDVLELTGAATEVGEHGFVLALDAGSITRVAELVGRGQGQARPRRRPWVQVDADRLIAWQLNWRGENFWSGGEIYGETEDTRSVFIKTDNTEFNKYIKDPARAGRRFFVITEAGRADGLRGLLPTPNGRETMKKVDTSCNKFTLLEFTL